MGKLKNKNGIDGLYKLLYMSFFVLFAFYLTAGKNAFYFTWAEGYSLFLYSFEYLKSCLQLPGGMLVYCGTFCMQFFRYPIIGSVIFIALLCIVQYLTVIVFRIPKRYYLLSFIPGLMLLLSVLELGYVWISLKSPGYFFSNTLGVILFLCGLYTYRSVKRTRTIIVLLFFYAVVGYSLFGFYALLLIVFCVLNDVIWLLKRKVFAFKYFLPIIIGVLLLFFIPRVYFYKVYNNLQLFFVYTSGLPRFLYNKKEIILWIPFVVLFFLFFFFSFISVKEKKSKLVFLFSFVLLLSAFGGVYFLSYQDENFRAEIKMNNAIECDDMKRVITIVSNLHGNPTQNMIFTYHYAVLSNKRAKAKNKEFNTLSKINSIRASLPIISVDMGWRTLLYRTGLVNDCYHWCMEDMVEYGMRINTLKYLVKCAIANEEYELAHKYNCIISKTLFDRHWADKYQVFIDNPELTNDDDEFRVIRLSLNNQETIPKQYDDKIIWNGSLTTK